MKQSKSISVRLIQPADNAAVAHIIRSVLDDFGGNKPGFAAMDPETDQMYEAYNQSRSVYYVLETDGRVIGGAGVAQLEGANPGICELRKMYFLSEARGQGWGKKLIEMCLADAVKFGYTQMYLETLTAMETARALYRRYGFQPLDKPMGDTGHSGCNTYMVKDLK